MKKVFIILVALISCVSSLHAEYFHKCTIKPLEATALTAPGVAVTKAYYDVYYCFTFGAANEKFPNELSAKELKTGKWKLSYPELVAKSHGNRTVREIVGKIKYWVTKGGSTYVCALRTVQTKPENFDKALADQVDGLVFTLTMTDLGKQRVYNGKTKKWIPCTWLKNGEPVSLDELHKLTSPRR